MDQKTPMVMNEPVSSGERSLLVIVFILLSLLIFFQLAHINPPAMPQQIVLPQINTASVTSQSLPVRLKIPKIAVNATVQHLGVTAGGAMEVPADPADVGWFKLGPRPGEKGSAVIAGHFDGKHGEAGVFYNLYMLRPGDLLSIVDAKGVALSFIVRKIHSYDPGYAEDVFSANDSAHLNLVTCDGVWDGTKKSYARRLVVFTDMIP